MSGGGKVRMKLRVRATANGTHMHYIVPGDSGEGRTFCDRIVDWDRHEDEMDYWPICTTCDFRTAYRSADEAWWPNPPSPSVSSAPTGDAP